jgi:hypothetical protein
MADAVLALTISTGHLESTVVIPDASVVTVFVLTSIGNTSFHVLPLPDRRRLVIN